MITRVIITQAEKTKEEKWEKVIVCVVKEDMMAFMPYESDVHIKHLLLCLHFTMSRKHFSNWKILLKKTKKKISF
jgi:hypothetical protein